MRNALALALPRSSVSLWTIWEAMRAPVLDAFPPEPGRPRDADAYLRHVEAVYPADACHSLRMEGYEVSEALVEHVSREHQDPYDDTLDAQPHEVAAAYGYWRAHNVVGRSLRRIVAGENPGAVAREAHSEWFLQLFSPSVEAGIVGADDLDAYREHPARIAGARHVPPPAREVPALMSELFDLLESEPSAAVRAVLGHFAFVFVHPYQDGSGRIARFLMNAMLASGGYPWTILRSDARDTYLSALESASSGADIGPFARLVAASLRA